jgi:CxxC motif-containing protein (DUF1111 family)
MSNPTIFCPACRSRIEAWDGSTSVWCRRCPHCHVRLSFSLAGTAMAGPTLIIRDDAPRAKPWRPALAFVALAAVASLVILPSLWPGEGPKLPDPVATTQGSPTPAIPAAEFASLSGLALGEALFQREWAPGDAVCEEGDGLGPLFNARSCVACHFQGGAGGGAPSSRNIDLLTASPGVPGSALTVFHPAFRDTPGLVIHKSGLDSRYGPWRRELLGSDANVDPSDIARFFPNREDDEFDLKTCRQGSGATLKAKLTTSGRVAGRATRSQRNATALFGAGLIDSIPDSALQAAARARFARFPEVRGRPNVLKGGQVGRFGWKAQEATLEGFVLTACAVELGLEVPGHHQSPAPHTPTARAPGLDLTERQCAALVDYVRSLPAPGVRAAVEPDELHDRRAGETLFHQVGCATCHVPNLANVYGIYSDLLLHDMGDDVSDDASFYGSESSPVRGPAPGSAGLDLAGRAKGAAPREWRTPPLWGVRDSAPYLHDGRAATIVQAVAFHGGQADRSARLFFRLSPEERRQIKAFLESRVAPLPNAPLAVASEQSSVPGTTE